MKITKIQQQKRLPDRYSIYIDEKYTFSLNEYQLIELRLHVGDSLTAGEVENFANESQFGKAYERTLNYIMIRPRSEKEVRDYLTRTFLYPRPKMYTNKLGERVLKKTAVNMPATRRTIDRVIERLREKNYLSDEAFAKAWVESRQFTKKPSRRRLQQELQQKGVSPEIIGVVLQNSDQNEQSNLLELVKKKQKLVRYQDDNKLIAYLLRQGFQYEDIKVALHEED